MSKTSHNRNKAPTSTKITAEQTIIIIRLIKKYKSIWDRNHPDFGKRQARYNAFKKIGSYFQLSAEDVSRKYRRFRNCYIQDLKRIRSKKKTDSNLFYFDEMDFLRDTIEYRDVNNESSVSLSMASSDAIIHSDYNFDTDEEIPVESIEDHNSLDPIEECQLSDLNENDEVILVAGAIEEETDVNAEPDASEGDCKLEKVEEQNVVESPSTVESDEFDIFAAYMASQLRAMNKLSALETMEELQRVIIKRRIQILKENRFSSD